MIGESVTPIGSQKTHQFLAFALREASAHADVLQRTRSVKQAKQKRADRRSVASFVPSKAGHDAIAVALMLNLEHHALVRLIGASALASNDSSFSRRRSNGSLRQSRSPSHSRSKKTIDAGLCRESSLTREAAG